MKKHMYAAAIFAVILMTINSVFAAVNIFDVPENISVNDYSVVMQPSTKAYIRRCNDTLMSSTGAKIIIVTVPTTGSESIDAYAERLCSAWGVSSIGNDTSTFVLFATDDMEYWAIPGTHIKNALTGEMLDDILLQFTEPDFSQRNFDSAAEKTFNAISSWYTTAYGMAPFSRSSNADDDTPANNAGSGTKTFWRIVRIAFVAAVIAAALFFIIRRYLRLYILSKRRQKRVVEYKRKLRRDLDIK